MSRMIDRVLAYGIANPHPKVQGVFGDAVPIGIQNVADYFYMDLEREWDITDFPNVAPPFRKYWLEYVVSPRHIPGSDIPAFSVGVLAFGADLTDLAATFGVDDGYRNLLLSAYSRLINGERIPLKINGRAALSPPPAHDEESRRVQMWALLTGMDWQGSDQEYFPGQDKPPDEYAMMLMRAVCLLPVAPVRWMTAMRVYVEAPERHIRGPQLYATIPVRHDGGVYGGIHIYHPEAQTVGLDTVRDEAYYLMNPALLALSFLHCKNVTLETTDPPAKLSKAFQRRNGRPLVRYHTLNIEPMRRVLKHEGQSEKTGLRKAMHICRGHFKDYSKHGLFGKYKGMYWWESHVRGSADEGAVLKDYNVTTPKQA